MSTVPVISLFSGAGGMDLGVEDAGGDVCVFVESDPDGFATLSSNRRFFPSATGINGDIRQLPTEQILAAGGLRKKQVALLVGGPPCQPFSKSGYWLEERRRGVEDERASLVDEYLRVLGEVQPEAFILENVAGLAHPSHRQVLDRVIATATRLGYATDWRLLHAVEYGVPQSRSRVFVTGIRGRSPAPFPPPTHWWHSEAGKTGRLCPPETAGRWIANLSNAPSEPREVVAGRWAELLSQVPPGWNYKFHTAWAGHRAPRFVAETKYWTFLLKLSPHRPSWTIQASAGPWTGPFHWESRRLRVPELAALQTFPLRYRFRGSRRAAVRQIGNAVPCRLAAKVAASVLGEVLGHRPRTGRRLRYKLVDGFEFDPKVLRHRGSRW
ncbi:MAG: DNA cytosine methyltransferase [Pirellulaceae bacterium]